MIPAIETDRLRLRSPDARDIAAFLDRYGTDRARFTGGPMDAAGAWRVFASVIGHWTLRGFGLWTVTRRGDDAAIGLVGCLGPEGWPEPEISWALYAGAEGRGYATEAARATRAFAYDRLGWTTAVSYIARENTRSAAVAARLGCRIDAGAPAPQGVACDVHRHPAPEACR
jgi:RimJ/RimL family protein N-acetyltransferase